MTELSASNNPSSVHTVQSVYKERYLPSELFGAVETELLKHGTLVARLYTIDDLAMRTTEDNTTFEGVARDMCNVIFRTMRSLNVDFPVYFCLVKNAEPNAAAICFNDWACIIVPDTLYSMTHWLLNAISHAEAFRTIGEPVQKPQGVAGDPMTRADMVRRIFTKKHDYNMDADQLLRLMTTLALAFVCNHELGHIINGHLRSGFSSTGTIVENHPIADSEQLAVMRALEFDADVFGVQHTLQLAFFWMESEAPRTAKFLGNYESSMHLVCVSIYAVLSIFESERGGDRNYMSGSHPPTPFRLQMVIAAAIELQKWWSAHGIDMGGFNVLDVAASAAIRVMAALSEMTGRPVDSSSINTDPLTASQLNEVLRRWAEVRPRLEKCKFGFHELSPAQY
jgi:Peptidase family M48